MANPEHVQLVKQGAEAIHRWRKEHPDIKLDLREADLRQTWPRRPLRWWGIPPTREGPLSNALGERRGPPRPSQPKG
jgi:hypothetical protein